MRLSATIAKTAWGTRMCVPADVFCMVAACLTAIGSGSPMGVWPERLRTPGTWPESLTLVLLGLGNCQTSPLAMGWPTVAVMYRYNRTQ